MSFVVETQSVVFTEGENEMSVTFSGVHSAIPAVTVSLENATNANFNAYTFETTTTGTKIRLSANAPSGLKAKVHIISKA
tara:strand:- start:1371 stop:1610 length:240 start_codon:yes stop_codon:yes gene_type:complete